MNPILEVLGKWEKIFYPTPGPFDMLSIELFSDGSGYVTDGRDNYLLSFTKLSQFFDANPEELKKNAKR